MRPRFIIAFTVLLAFMALTLVSCSDSMSTVTTNANPTTPKFLIAVDGSGAGNNVNVFPINSTTGVLGTAVVGSPFNLNVTDIMTVAVHPNGHFVYAADGNDGSIHAWDVNESTGVPTEVGTSMVNTSGSFYEPSGSGDSPTHVITVTPSGSFLYSANNDSNVGAYKINTNGSLTHIGDLATTACETGAITANDSFVWVTDTCSSTWNVFTMKINSDGSLSNVGSVALSGVYSWLWSIQVNPAANLLYVGDEGGDAQVYSFSIASDGTLTQLGPQLVENLSSDCRDISHSADGKTFYTTDDDEVLHAFTVDTSTGAITEQAGSPFAGGAGQLVVDATGHFIYMGDQQNTGQVVAYSRDTTTGAVTPIGNTTTANGLALAIGIVR